MSQTVRITGTALRVEHVSGVAKASGNPFSMDVLHVLVGDSGIAEAVFPRNFSGRMPSRGDQVDYLASIDATSGGRLNVSLIEPWPAELVNAS